MNRHASLEIARPLFNGGVLLMPVDGYIQIPFDTPGHRPSEGVGVVVLAWMPATSLYFRDLDGNLLELLSMLPEDPQPELGVISWSRWKQSDQSNQIRRTG